MLNQPSTKLHPILDTVNQYHNSLFPLLIKGKIFFSLFLL